MSIVQLDALAYATARWMVVCSAPCLLYYSPSILVRLVDEPQHFHEISDKIQAPVIMAMDWAVSRFVG